ncbi:hypothetical protein V2J09_008323 [Rumex salicifolius]
MPLALVVEDDVAVASLHETLLRNSGFTTRVAKNGHEAVDIVSLGDKLDLILMKDKIPIMDGGLATMMIRALDVKCLIVGVTSSEKTDELERQAFIASGLDECFEIPLNSEKISKIFHLLENGGYLTN